MQEGPFFKTHPFSLPMTQTFTFSKLVFGTWRLADKHSSEPLDILKRIKKCLEFGINTFDLAGRIGWSIDIYGGYTYEALFGKALALEPSLRSQMQIVTKCDIQYPVNGRDVALKYYDTSKEYIIWSVKESLKKIGIEYLDVLLIHRPDPLMNADEVAEAFNELKSQGLVKFFGVSNFTPSQFDLLQSRLDYPLVTNQVEYSVLHTTPMYDGTFDQMQKLRVTPMIWSPLAGGRLFTEKTEQVARVVKQLEVVAKEIGPNITIDQIAYAWILRAPCNACIVVGTNDLDRLAKVVNAVPIKLSRPQWFSILEASHGCEVP